MGIASFSPSLVQSYSQPVLRSKLNVSRLSILLAPVQALVALLMPVQPAQANYRPATASPAPRLARPAQLLGRSPTPDLTTTSTYPTSRLKIMHEFEPGMGRAQTGRMAISGRMADVCAELDRISQKESLKA